MAYWKKLCVGVALLGISPIAIPLIALGCALAYLLFAGCFIAGAATVTWTK